MSVLDMRPHSLTYLSVTEGYRDDNGDWHKGSEQWSEDNIDCDTVPAGPENVLTYEDGTMTNYEHVIYTDCDCREFKRGDKIRIAFYGELPATEFTVKGFHRYQHQCKIWV